MKNYDIVTFQKSQLGLPTPTKITKQEKYWIYSDGGRSLDILAGGSAFTLGYCNNEIIDAMSDELKMISRCQSHLGYVSDSTKLASKTLCDLGGFDGLIYAVTGTGAVEVAIAVQDAYWKSRNKDRPKIISFTPVWHGTSMITQELSGFPAYVSGRVVPLPLPDWHQIKDREEAEDIVLKQVTESIDDNVGSIIFDPCPWFTGTKAFSARWWKKIREVCDENDILMIVDDIALCWGKCNAWYSFQSLGEGVQPDINIVGKSITAGHAPLSAAMFSRKLSFHLKNRADIFYGHTVQPYMGGIAALLKTHEIIERDSLIAKSKVVRSRLSRLAMRYVYNHRVCGTFLAIDLPKGTLINKLNKFGLSGRILDRDVLKICAPLIADDEYFEELQDKLDLMI